jgi:hypothetical protein
MDDKSGVGHDAVKWVEDARLSGDALVSCRSVVWRDVYNSSILPARRFDNVFALQPGISDPRSREL